MHKLLVVAILVGGAGGASADPYDTTLSFGDPTVAGKLAATAVSKVVKRSAKKLQACFDERGIMPLGQLELTARFTIAGTGKVAASVIENLDDEAAATCMAGVIAKLRFARPRDRKPVEVAYPLLIDPPAAGGAFASLTGTGDISSGLDDGNTHEAGGGGGVGTIGTGRYGTIGHGAGTGNGYGIRGGAAVPTVSIGQPVVTGPGTLDKAIIRRYIKRNIQRLQYCYEKELLVSPKLHGTVTVALTIDENGSVASATASGMKSEPVESCVATAIKAIEFPKPTAGAVSVTYPFTYSLPVAK